MVDIFMLVVIILLIILVLFVCFYILIYFSHPDDSGFGSGIACKIVGVLGLLIAFSQIILLPLDVGNNRGNPLNFNMQIIWKVVYLAIIAFSFIIVPLMTAIYETNPELKCIQKLLDQFLFFFAEVLVIAVLFTICYFIFNKANIPVNIISCSIMASKYASDRDIENYNFLTENYKYKSTSLELSVNFIIFSIGLLSFISYFLFTVFGGIGLIALPLDMLYSFCTRPKKISKALIDTMSKEIVETAFDLKDLASDIKKMEDENINLKPFYNKQKREYNLKLKQLKVGVSVLEKKYSIIDMQNAVSGMSVIGYWVNLFGGIILLLVSLLWIAQIVIYLLIKKDGKPLHGLLNIPLVYLTNKGVSFVAIAIFAVLTFYLLMCTMKGNFKFGLRFPLLGTIHEMKKNETYMNTILFNIMLLMISSVSITQFSVKCFNEYTSMTDIDIIFNTLVKNLKFFKYFFKYNVFEYALCVIMFISLLYLATRPNDANTVKKILYKKLNDKKKEKEKDEEDTSMEKLIELNAV